MELVVLSEDEKLEMISTLTEHLPALRKTIGLSQDEFGMRAGTSRRRISLIENKDFVMTWSQFTSFCFVFSLNKASKDYIFQHALFPKRLYQFLQCKDGFSEPDLYTPISATLKTSFFADPTVIDLLLKKNNSED